MTSGDRIYLTKGERGIFMDENRLKEAGIDYDGALDRFVGNRMLYEKYLTKFLSDTHVADARAALLREDYPDLLEQTHALKGLAGTLGMTGLYEKSADIVKSLRAEEREGIEEQLHGIELEHQRMLELIRS